MILIFLYTLATAVVIKKLYHSRDFVGVMWFFLIYLYTFPAYNAYVFFPVFFEYIGVYKLHQDGVYFTGIYLIISLLVGFAAYNYGSNKNSSFDISCLPALSRGFAYLLFILMSIFYVFLIFNFKDLFSWGAGQSNIPGFFWIYFRIFEVVTFFWLLSLFGNFNFKFICAFLVFILTLFVNFKSGNRSDILYLLLGFAFIKLNKLNFEFNLFNLCSFLSLVALILTLLQMIYLFRSMNISSLDFSEILNFIADFYFLGDDSAISYLNQSIHVQDYFAPAATLPMAINQDTITWLDAAESILGNIVPGFGYLTTSDLVVSQYGLSFDRGTGFAYNFLTDGFLLFGFLGAFILPGLYSYFLGILKSVINKQKSIVLKNILLLVLGFYMLQFIRNSIGQHVLLFYMGILPTFLLLLLFRNIFSFSVNKSRLQM